VVRDLANPLISTTKETTISLQKRGRKPNGAPTRSLLIYMAEVKVKKLFTFCLFVIVLSVLSGIGRSSGSNPSVQDQFTLKASYPVENGDQDLLATIYSAGSAHRQKEILSIWSQESYGYELQYIRTAATGESFLKPSAVHVQDMNFMHITTHKGPETSTVATLWLAPDSTLHEVTSHHAQELMKHHSNHKP